LFTLSLADGAELRPLEPWQAAEFLDHVERARAHLEPWLPWARTITDEDSARRWLQGYADKLATDRGRLLGIWVDGRLSGGVAYRTFDAGAGDCELGVWVSPEAQGRGLIRRGAAVLIEHAFTVRGLHRVEWRAAAGNARSRAAAKRLGFQLDGVLREGYRDDGVPYDVEVWSLLAAEWPPVSEP